MNIALNKTEDMLPASDEGYEEPAFIRGSAIYAAPSVISVATATSAFGLNEGESLEDAINSY